MNAAVKARIRIVPTATGQRYHVQGLRQDLIADVADPQEAELIAGAYLKGLGENVRLVTWLGDQVAELVADAKAAAREMTIGGPDPHPVERRGPAAPSVATIPEGGTGWPDVERRPLDPESRRLAVAGRMASDQARATRAEGGG